MVIISVETESKISDSASLVSFPQGVNDEMTTDMELSVGQKGSGRKRKQMVVADLNGITLRGTDFGEHSAKNDNCQFAIGIVDGKGKKMKVVPVGHAFTMIPLVGDSKSTGDRESMSAYERRKSLTEAFGSSKKKRAVRAAESNIISLDNIAGAKALEVAVGSSTSVEGEDSSEPAVKVDAAEEALEQSRRLMLPSYNISATTVEDIYPVSELIPKNIQKALEEVYEGILTGIKTGVTGVTSSAVSSESSLVGMLIQGASVKEAAPKEEAAQTGVIGDPTKIGSWEDAMTQRMPTIPPVVFSILRSAQGKFNSKKTRKAVVCQILLLSCMLRFYIMITSKYNISVEKDSVLGELSPLCPGPIINYITSKFSNYRKGKGTGMFSCTKSDLDKLLCHIIVFAFSIGGSYTVDLSAMAVDLKITINVLTQHAQEIGCSIKKRNGFGVEESEKSTYVIAELTVPLKFPGRRRGRM